MFIRICLLFVYAFLSLACSRSTAIHDLNTNGVNRILFVGNSLTYTNDLPAMVIRIAAKKGIKVETKVLAYANYSLEDHWNDGRMQYLLSSSHFDYLVVQQGPSSQEDGRVMLQDYGKRLKLLCNQHQTKLAFFMVWPSIQNFQTFDGVIKNYADAAATTQSILCPVGEVWKKYILSSNDYSYYDSDQFHPSVKGSEVAATIIVETLFN
jgi:hypothetical protein